MSFASRIALRAVVRSKPRQALARGYASTAPGEVLNVQPTAEGLVKLLESDKDLIHHAAQASDLWRKISFYVCIPTIAVCLTWVYNVETEHSAHIEHVKHENGGELPPTPAFEYMNKRVKPFPWGMNSLFFNPHVNMNLDETA